MTIRLVRYSIPGLRTFGDAMKPEDLAARILIVYESNLPMDGRANLAERMDAMRKTVDALGLHEVHGNVEIKPEQ